MDKRITNIVFTKNRPMQLRGYLEGLRRFLPAELIQTHILYKPELFDEQYEQLFEIFSDCMVVRETDFHADLLAMIDNADTEYLLFGIDDVVYFDGVDFEAIEQAFNVLGDQLFGFSLRLDTRQMPEDIEAGNTIEHSFAGDTVMTVDWTQGQTKSSRYPFELCATIMRTADVKRIVVGTMVGGKTMHRLFSPGAPMTQMVEKVYPKRKLLKKLGYFFNPNTFESWCCRYVGRHKDDFGKLLAFQKICASAIQVNVVNTSTNTEGENDPALTVEKLSERYKNGDRIDIDAIMQNKPLQTHAGADYFKLKCGS